MPGGEQQEARLTSRSDHGGKLYGPHQETGCEAPLTLYGQHQDQIHILKTKHPDVSADDGRPGRSQVQRGPPDNSGEKGGRSAMPGGSRDGDAKVDARDAQRIEPTGCGLDLNVFSLLPGYTVVHSGEWTKCQDQCGTHWV